MLAPIRRKRDFAHLSGRGRRGRSGPVWVLRAPSEGEATRVAYAVGRNIGPAVVRNRIRRRLRVLMTELDRDGVLGPGMYLVGASRTADDLDFRRLRQHLESAVEAAS